MAPASPTTPTGLGTTPTGAGDTPSRLRRPMTAPALLGPTIDPGTGCAEPTPPDRAGRRRRRRRLRATALVAAVLAALGLLVGLQVHARAELRATGASLGSVRGQLHRAAHELAQAQQALAVAVDERTWTATALTGDSAQLSAVEARLSSTEADLFVAGVSASDLDECLGGVQVALNEVALHDPGGALRSIQSVAASCRAVQAAAG